VNGIEVELEPLKVAVAEIALTDFFSRLILSADGTLNLQTLMRESGASAAKPVPAPAAAGAPPDIRLGKVVLSGGSVSYSDFLVTPNYSVMLTGVGGSVTAITPEQPGEVELHARIHQTAPVDIAGRINPLAKDLFVDLKVSARDIDLSPLTPYSVKYAGYGIDKGRLSVKLAYRIENGKLVAENNIYLDQLTFGAKVGSHTATDLPVLLAVALLKDKNGVIDVNVPVSGSLDSPEFNVGNVLGQVFGNLVKKTVSSPFAALGSLVGGGEELAFLEFAPGSATLPAGDTAKLTSLAKALAGRPGLTLDVSGRIDPAADREVLKRAELDRQVEAAKLKAGGELSAAELEKLKLAEVQVSDGELRQLANARAQAAKDWLVASGKIAPERIFISTPNLGAEGIKDQGKPTRVDFSLR
jgi:hypothetical protein